MTMLRVPFIHFIHRRRPIPIHPRDAILEFVSEGEGEMVATRPRVAVRAHLLHRAVRPLVAVAAIAGTGALAYGAYLTTTPAEGVLRVETEPAAISVLIDGTPRGRTPLTMRLPKGSHEMVLEHGDVNRHIPVTIVENGETVHHVAWAERPLPDVGGRPEVGSLAVVTDPPGANVEVDGVGRGVAPLTVATLTPGTHTVVIRNKGVVRQRSIVVDAGARASLVVAMAPPAATSGWLTVSAATPLQVFEGGALVGTSETPRIMLPVGTHDLELRAPALGFRMTKTVEVTSGGTSTVTVALDRVPLGVNAIPWAEVWIDGNRAGETPLAAVPTTIGTHQIEFRHPDLGRKVVPVTVSLKEPARVSVDMRAK